MAKEFVFVPIPHTDLSPLGSISCPTFLAVRVSTCCRVTPMVCSSAEVADGAGFANANVHGWTGYLCSRNTSSTFTRIATFLPA
jgi:hypothetical protein